MKIFKLSELNVPIFQGDIMLKVVPAKESKRATAASGNVIAHSESGHDHTADGAQVLNLDPMTMFIKPDGKGFIDGVPYVDIVHHRPYETHETYRLFWDVPDVVVKIKRQRERTPAGWRRVED